MCGPPSWAGSSRDTAAASRVSAGWSGPWWPLEFSWWAVESQLGGPPRGPGPHGVLTGSESCTPGHTRPHYTAANDCHHCAVVLESKNALSYSWHKIAPTPNYSTLPHTAVGVACVAGTLMTILTSVMGASHQWNQHCCPLIVSTTSLSCHFLRHANSGGRFVFLSFSEVLRVTSWSAESTCFLMACHKIISVPRLTLMLNSDLTAVAQVLNSVWSHFAMFSSCNEFYEIKHKQVFLHLVPKSYQTTKSCFTLRWAGVITKLHSVHTNPASPAPNK